ncbi:MAG: hypothetical protein PWQ91_70 [Eubacteriales bacterium]|nr:hypothetical protein [Eubacteriales bacterium]
MEDLLKQILLGINSMDKRLQNLESDVSGLKTDVSALKTDVSTLKTDVSTLKTDVAHLKADVSTLKADVAVLKTEVNRLSNRMDAVYEQVAGLTEFRTEVSQKLNEIAANQEILAEITGRHEVHIKRLQRQMA